jgi:hypothetical protein
MILEFKEGYKLDGVDVPYLNEGDIPNIELGKSLKDIRHIILVSQRKYFIYKGDATHANS